MVVTLTFGERLKDARTVHNKNGKQTLQEVMVATGVNTTLISDLENDKDRGADYRNIGVLAKHYGVSLDWLIDGGENPVSREADIHTACKTTGLSEGAISKLRATLAVHRAIKSENLCDGVLPFEILSRLIEDSEFWRVLNHLYQSTSSVSSEYVRLFNGAQPDLPEATTVETEMYPLADSLQEMCVASATIHFGNAVRRALGWGSDSESQKKEEKTTEASYYGGRPRVDLNDMVDAIQNAERIVRPEK